MATTKQILPVDKKTTRSFLNQLIDVLQEDVSSSISRRKYQVFVTGGIGPGVTSSLFQTVYDQDFTLQTANPIFDITVGLASPGASRGATTNETGIAGVASTGLDSGGKYLYPSSSLMMREKTDIYSQFAQTLLGDRDQMFILPADISVAATATTDQPIDAALFIAFKRLFARDQIKRETFAMRFYQSASWVSKYTTTAAGEVPRNSLPRKSDNSLVEDANGVPNMSRVSASGSMIVTDIGSAESRYSAIGGQFGYLVNASNTSAAVGLMYYDTGIAVLDLEKITSGSQFMSGTISAMNNLGRQTLGGVGTETAYTAKFIPDLLTSGSVDDIIDHLCYTRFGDSSLTAITFQNVTNINSSLIFCRALPDDFNYSSNPTYVEPAGTTNEGRLTIYDPSLPEELQEPFAYITTIGLYDNAGGLLAVAKLSRPVEKNPSRDLTFRVRLDF